MSSSNLEDPCTLTLNVNVESLLAGCQEGLRKNFGLAYLGLKAQLINCTNLSTSLVDKTITSHHA